MYVTFKESPDVIAIHAASLQDPSRFIPQMATYTSRGYAWDQLDSNLIKFETMPTA